MAVVAANTFEGGVDGTTITTGNSGGASGTAFESVTVGTGATTRYSSAQAMHGSLSYEFATAGTSASSFVSWVASLGTVSESYARFYLRLTVLPSSSGSIFAYVSGSTARYRVQITTAGLVRVLDTAGATVFTTTAALSTGTWYRIEVRAVLSATVGQTEVRLFAGDSTTAIEIQTSGSTVNFGGTCDRVRYGCITNQLNFPSTFMDDVAVGTSWIGPAAQSVLLGQAVETSAANPVGGAKTRALGLAQETDTATAIGGAKSRSTGQATEASLAQPVAGGKAFLVGQVLEVDTAAVVGRAKILTLGLASSDDTAAAFAFQKSATIGQAEELDTAQPISAAQATAPAGRGTVTLVRRSSTAIPSRSVVTAR